MKTFFKVLGIALSGGRDSTLTLLIAHRCATRARPSDPGSLLHTFKIDVEINVPSALRGERNTICAPSIDH